MHRKQNKRKNPRAWLSARGEENRDQTQGLEVRDKSSRLLQTAEARLALVEVTGDRFGVTPTLGRAKNAHHVDASFKKVNSCEAYATPRIQRLHYHNKILSVKEFCCAMWITKILQKKTPLRTMFDGGRAFSLVTIFRPSRRAHRGGLDVRHRGGRRRWS